MIDKGKLADELNKCFRRAHRFDYPAFHHRRQGRFYAAMSYYRQALLAAIDGLRISEVLKDDIAIRACADLIAYLADGMQQAAEGLRND